MKITMITEIGNRIVKPIPIVGETVLLVRGIFRQRGHSNTFLLNTIMKSGTQYLKAIISNYLVFQFLAEENRLGFVESDAKIWYPKQQQRKTIERLYTATGYERWKHEHENPYIRYNNAKVIVHTYRNPLDNIVSRYYLSKNRKKSFPYPNPGYNDNHPRDAIDRILPDFIRHFTQIKKISHRPNVKRVAYENFVRNPFDTVKDIFSFANIPVHEDSLQRAIDVSSVDWVRADERRYKVEGGNKVTETSENAIGVHMKISHVRSGKVGEWKEYFNDEDVKKISDILAQKSISLNDFILE